ncbi:MAG: M23 family metallopeptidase [Pseudomonadota bacterium]|nr:M23 family metallopeptidase [Pseudomonadota bacterium]
MNLIHKITSKRWFGLAETTRKTRIVGAGAVVLTVAAFGAVATAPVSADNDANVKSIAQDLALPNLSEQIASMQQNDQQFIHEDRVRAGDSLGEMMKRLGVEDQQAVSFIRSDKVARAILQLKTGKRIQAETDENGELITLEATLADASDMPTSTVTIARKNGKLVASQAPVKLERRVEMRSRTISNSLYSATDSATDGSAMPDGLVKQVIQMFSTNIDFRTDLKRGDHFNVVYETFWQNGEMVKVGKVLAGEFTNRGLSYQSVWFEDPVTKQGGYYTLDGKALKKAFLRSPIEFSRISSGFAMRSHPITGNWKQHKGVDFAAPNGTPIHASGDGVVDYAGSGMTGYGNMVVLKHWSNYSTAYAHMSRFASNLRKGQHVNQGDVIGYVGSTGWSTGNHLHYEFRVANQARDPMSLGTLAQQPLNSGELARFKMAAVDMRHRFALLSPAATAAPRLASR